MLLLLVVLVIFFLEILLIGFVSRYVLDKHAVALLVCAIIWIVESIQFGGSVHVVGGRILGIGATTLVNYENQ